MIRPTSSWPVYVRLPATALRKCRFTCRVTGVPSASLALAIFGPPGCRAPPAIELVEHDAVADGRRVAAAGVTESRARRRAAQHRARRNHDPPQDDSLSCRHRCPLVCSASSCPFVTAVSCLRTACPLPDTINERRERIVRAMSRFVRADGGTKSNRGHFASGRNARRICESGDDSVGGLRSRGRKSLAANQPGLRHAPPGNVLWIAGQDNGLTIRRSSATWPSTTSRDPVVHGQDADPATGVGVEPYLGRGDRCRATARAEPGALHLAKPAPRRPSWSKASPSRGRPTDVATARSPARGRAR